MAITMSEVAAAAIVGGGDVFVVQWDRNRAITETFQRFQDWYPIVVAGVGLGLGMQRGLQPRIQEFVDSMAVAGVALSVSRLGGIFIEQTAGQPAPARAFPARAMPAVSYSPPMAMPGRGMGAVVQRENMPTVIG